MRAYIVDELGSDDLERFENHLKVKADPSTLGGLYWLNLPQEILSEEQREHTSDCGPHAFGIEITEDSVVMELLVRARSRMRCSCVAYADAEQRAWGMETLDSFFKELDIPV